MSTTPRAIQEAMMSPCQKSKRGVVFFNDSGTLRSSFKRDIVGHNRPPFGMACDGSDACRAACGKICLHAEHVAIAEFIRSLNTTHNIYTNILHLKVVDGEAVPSGPPSCWQCSREILDLGDWVDLVWLLHNDGMKSYTPQEFHRMTLERCGLPFIEVGSRSADGG